MVLKTKKTMVQKIALIFLLICSLNAAPLMAQNRNALLDSINLLNTIIEAQNNRIDSLEAQIEGRDKRIQMLTTDSIQSKQVITQKDTALENKVIEQFGNYLPKTHQFFCHAVMESPLLYKYNKELIQFSLETAKALGYENSQDPNIKKWYNGLYKFLINYEKYNQELVKCIDRIWLKAGRDQARKECESCINDMEYMEERTETFHIFYLDFQIKQLRDLFKDDNTFKQENFDKIKSFLMEKSTK